MSRIRQVWSAWSARKCGDFKGYIHHNRQLFIALSTYLSFQLNATPRSSLYTFLYAPFVPARLAYSCILLWSAS